MSDTRRYDLQELRKAYRNTQNAIQRKLINDAGTKIRKETRAIKDMREALIKEHRRGNTANIKDIHDIVSKKLKYQNY